jgi:hypothetical protein
MTTFSNNLQDHAVVIIGRDVRFLYVFMLNVSAHQGLEYNVSHPEMLIVSPWWILYLQALQFKGYDFFGVEKGWQV